MGNPLNWHNASAFTWEGRRLKSLTKADGTVISYAYDENGIRTGKTVGSESVRYILDGTRILKEIRNAYTLTFLYDNSGTLIGFNYNNGTTSADYYYGIDNWGNINYIYDSTGAVVVTYKYDAWGNAISTTGTLAGTIGAINPYRYKSYYYDAETGLYYLQSRYYDAKVQRFVSEDEPMLVGVTGGIYSYNLYAYCENDPVNNVDVFGYASLGESWNDLKREYGALTPEEKRLFKRYWYYAFTIYRCRKQSFIWAEKFYGKYFYTDDWEANAFKHAMWSACMSFELGSYIAELFGTAHESETMKSRDSYIMAQTQMDLHNNEVGRAIGELYAKYSKIAKSMYRMYGSKRLSTPVNVNFYLCYNGLLLNLKGQYDYQNLAYMVLSAARKGDLIWIK